LILKKNEKFVRVIVYWGVLLIEWII
jgi:hypothetical protein